MRSMAAMIAMLSSIGAGFGAPPMPGERRFPTRLALAKPVPAEPNEKMRAAAEKRKRKGEKLQAIATSGAIEVSAPRPPPSQDIPAAPLRFQCQTTGCETREGVAVVIPGPSDLFPFGFAELATALRGGGWDLVTTADPDTLEVVCPRCRDGRLPARTESRLRFSCAGESAACANAIDVPLDTMSLNALGQALRAQRWNLAVGGAPPGSGGTTFWDAICPACTRILATRMLETADDPEIRAKLEEMLTLVVP